MKKRLLFILCLLFAAANSSAAQTKSVTNGDLEKFRQKRVQTEREYRENYAKLGFPSPEELEKQNAESRRKLAELSRQIEDENAESEDSFAARASFLRTQIASVEGQINYLRGELNRLPRQNLFFSSGIYSSFAGGFYGQSGYNNSRRPFQRRPVHQSPRGNYAGGNDNSINLSANGAGFGVSIVTGNGNANGNYRGGYTHRNNYNGNFGGSIYSGGYIAPYFGGGVNRGYERDELFTQIRALEQERAGLYAERSILEDEARRAGVKIN